MNCPIGIKNFVFAFSVLLVSACSTTRVLSDGQYMLSSVDVLEKGEPTVTSRQMAQYVRQKPATFNPFRYVYNWAPAGGGGLWGKFVRKIGVPPVIYDPDQVEVSSVAMKDRLQYLGWYNSGVDAKVSVRGKKVKVVYDLAPGTRYLILNRKIVFPQNASESFVNDFASDTSNVTILPGDYLSEAALDSEAKRASALMRSKGYFAVGRNDITFLADTVSLPKGALLTMRAGHPSADSLHFAKHTFGKVTASYPQRIRFRDGILRRLNTIKPGAPFNDADVKTTYNRLTGLRVFSGVGIELNQSDSARVDCDIRLNPARLQGFKLDFETSTNSSGLLGVSPGLTFYHRNLFHGSERLNLGLSGSFQFKPNDDVRSTEFGVSAGLSIPRFLFAEETVFPEAQPSTDIKAAYNYQNRPEYTRNMISTSFGYTGSHKDMYYSLFPVQLNVVRVSDIESGFRNSLESNPFLKNAFRNHFDLGIGLSLYKTSNADVNPRTSYRYMSLGLSMAGNLLNALKPYFPKDSDGTGLIWGTPYSQYIRCEGSYGRTWRLGRKDQDAVAIRLLAGAGFAYGNSDALPFEQHFYSGGSASMRGWQARSVGPGNSPKDRTFVIPNQTGDMKFEADIEFRKHLLWKLDGALFAEAGNVWTLNGSSDDNSVFRVSGLPRSLAADWGLGLRMDINFILLRVDVGMQIHDPAQPQGQRWVSPKDWLSRDNYAIHFGVGYPF